MSLPDPEQILEALRQRPATVRGLGRRLGLDETADAGLLQALHELTRRGRVRQHRGRFHADAGEADRVVGRFQRNASGFGFLRPDLQGEPDVYLSRRQADGLMHGDRIEVRVVREDHRGPRGRVLQVVERASRRVIGVLELRGRVARVMPFEARIARHISLAPGRTLGAADRMAVGVEILQPPDEEGVARGRIVEVLGYPDAPGMDIEIIIRRFDLRHEWPDAVTEEIESLPGEPRIEDEPEREDFRALPTVTIDGATAKDFDDAISLERVGGGYRLYVHIADVAHYVREGSAIDAEAGARGTSVYFPGRAVPMLPERLSNDLCSLRPRVPRLVQTAILEIDRAGELQSSRFVDGVIESAERMTYTDVGGILVDRDESLRERYASSLELFEEMERLCRVLGRRRRARGSIDFDLPQPEIVLNARGEMTGVFPAERTIAHQIVEEFMLAANEAVAGHLLELRVPSLYRVHEEPELTRLEALDEILATLGYRLPRPLENILPHQLQEVLGRVEGRPEERFVSRLVLRAMQQARYDPQNLGHFGLAAQCYTHFTSPIRRYPDLVVHRVLRASRRGDLTSQGEAAGRLRSALPQIAAESSRLERQAEAAERELLAWKKIDFMAEKLGEEFHGFVSAVMSFGMFVELEEFFVEGLVHVSTMTDDHYRFSERGQLLRGDRNGRAFRLGDRVHVQVVKVDHFLKRMDLELVVGDRRRDDANPSRGRQRGARRSGRRRG